MSKRSSLSIETRVEIAWAVVGALLTLLAGGLLWYRGRFDWALELRDIPSIALAVGLSIAGVVFLAVLPLVRGTHDLDGARRSRILLLVVAVGFLLRLMMFPTEPALEDDQQRYLWEGALVANGVSPYAVAPADAATAAPGSVLARLATAAGPVLERVNHSDLKTIYPPVAEAAFALAYWMRPFSLTAWRAVLLAADAATLVMLMQLLDATGRARIWLVLYWWNPIVIKELFNSAHMEGILTPWVLLALLFAHRKRPLCATGALGMAVGVKLWPILLLPLVLRPLLDRRGLLAAAVGLMTLLVGAWVLPIVLGGIDERSGFVAYASRWQANSAMLPVLRGGVEWLFGRLGGPVDHAGTAVRVMLAGIAVGVALWSARRPIENAGDLMARASIVTLTLVLVSPAQFPWYAIWTLCFLPFVPRRGVIVMAVTMPIYYASFHFAAWGLYGTFRDVVVWAVWVPVWLVLMHDYWFGHHHKE